MALHHGLRSFSASLRRTVFAYRRCVHGESNHSRPPKSLQRPSALPAVGLEQAFGEQEASSLPVQFYGVAPGRCFFAKCGFPCLPSTQSPWGPIDRGPFTTPMFVARSPRSLRPAAAASKICARLSLRAECPSPTEQPVNSLRSAWG